jgi:Ca-activated chloride channel family protein
MRRTTHHSILMLALLLAASSGRAQTLPSASPTPARPPVLQGVSKADDKSLPALPDDKSPREIGEDEVLRVDTNLVSVPFSVLDASGKYVTDLKQSDVRVFENSVEQRVASFYEISQPTFVVLLLDVSTSVMRHFREIKEAAVAFTDQLRETDYVYPVAFSGKVFPLLPRATSDRAALREAIRNMRVVDDGKTSIYDAVQRVSDEILKKFRGRKALILFTDGEDVSSRRAKKNDNLRDAQELDALIYTVQYPRELPIGNRQYLSLMTPAYKDYLRRLAENSGGRYFKGDKPEKVKAAFASIAEELRRQYVVAYYAMSPLRAGQSRRVRVTVTRSGTSARTRKNFVRGKQ